MNSLASIDIVILIVYFVGMVAVGTYFSKKIKGQDSYSIADRSLTMPVMIGTTCATVMGAGCAFGDVGYVAEEGLSALIAIATWNVGWIALVVMAGRLRDSGAESLPDFLRIRYGTSTKVIGAIITLTMILNTTAAQFTACGTIVQTLGLGTMSTGIIVGGICIILLTIFGGLYAVAWTDAIQMVLIFVGVCIVVPIIAFKEAGGIVGITEYYGATNPAMLSWTNIGALTLVGYSLSYMLAAGCNPSYAQRILASKDKRTAVWGSVWSNVLTLIIAIPVELCGLMAIIAYPSLSNGEMSVPIIIYAFFPAVAKGLMIAALLGMVITTADTYLLLLSSSISSDICKVVWPKLDDRQLLKISRSVTLVGGMLAIFLAVKGSSVFLLFRMGAAAYGAGMFFPLLLGCYWKRATTMGVNSGMLIGCFFTYFWNWTLRESSGIEGVMPGALLCLVVTVVTSLLTQNKGNLEGIK